ncbi:MAG: IS982 family transposase, partial [Bacteroidota bacterium]
MHNIKSNFDKIYQTIKSLNTGLFNQDDNIPKRGSTPQFSDLEVISLALTVEYMSLDSENWLFNKIEADYADDFTHLIERTRFNRRK